MKARLDITHLHGGGDKETVRGAECSGRITMESDSGAVTRSGTFTLKGKVGSPKIAKQGQARRDGNYTLIVDLT